MNNTNKFELCLALATIIVQRVKCNYPGAEHIYACTGGGISPGESMEEIFKSYQNNLPGLIKVISDNLYTLDQAIYNSSAAIAPQEAESQVQIFKNQAPVLNAIGQDIIESNALRQAETDGKVLAGPGGELINQAVSKAKQIDPQFEYLRSGIGAFGGDLLSSLRFDNGLSGSEREEVGRSLARDNAATGNLDTPSAIATIENALSFGRAGEARKNERQKIGAGVMGTLGQIAPNLRLGIDPLQVGVGRPSTLNTGVGAQTGIAPNTSQAGLGFGTNVLNLTGQTANTYAQANSASPFDRIMQGLEGVGGLFGSSRKSGG